MLDNWTTINPKKKKNTIQSYQYDWSQQKTSGNSTKSKIQQITHEIYVEDKIYVKNKRYVKDEKYVADEIYVEDEMYIEDEIITQKSITCIDNIESNYNYTQIIPTIQMHKLNDIWVLWYHDFKNSDWTLSGFQQIFTFSTIEDFWILYNNITDITNGMYYLMRQGIPPLWDHELNINGAGWTFKVDKRDLLNFWQDISCYCIGETISLQSRDIVGISTSPKIKYATVRVWTNNAINNPMLFEPIMQKSLHSSVKIDFNEARFTINKDASK